MTKTRTNFARTLKGRCRCGKVRYPSRTEADLALASCRGSASHARHEQRAYQCPLCRAWHLTSRPLVPPAMTPDEYRQYAERYSKDHTILHLAWRAARIMGLQKDSDVMVYAVAVMKLADETGDPDRFLTDETTWTMTIRATRPERSLTSRVNTFRPIFAELKERLDAGVNAPEASFDVCA